MEYRFSFFMGLIANVLRKLAEYFSLWILMQKFTLVDGWGLYDVWLLFTVNQFAISLSGLFLWTPMMELETLVQDGHLDGLLVRPINVFLHLILRKFDVTFLGNLTLSILMFIVCMSQVAVHWSLLNVFSFVITIIGAVLIYASIHVFVGSFSFSVVRMNMVLATVLDFRRFLFFPISIYGKEVVTLLTFVIPLGFINYYPLLPLLHKPSVLLPSTELLPVVACLLGTCMFLVSYRFFNHQVTTYQGTGS
jgi:ABC-2 type transport system permease protein